MGFAVEGSGLHIDCDLGGIAKLGVVGDLDCAALVDGGLVQRPQSFQFDACDPDVVPTEDDGRRLARDGSVFAG